MQQVYQEAHQSLPAFEAKLTIDALRVLQEEVAVALDRRKSELAQFTPPDAENSDQKIEEYARVIRESEIVAQERIERGETMCQELKMLNVDLDDGIKARIQARIQRRARSPYLYKNDASRCHDDATIMTSLIPNLSVEREVHQVSPATIEEIEQTKQLILQTPFTLDTTNRNAPFHIFTAIARQSNLGFALMPSPPPEVLQDSWNRPIDFAMENDVISDGSLFLLGSTCPHHEAKAVSVDLKGDLNALESDVKAKAQYIGDLKTRLSRIHQVNPYDIVILSLRSGSIAVTYSIPPTAAPVIDL
jgi:hypothetical protein